MEHAERVKSVEGYLAAYNARDLTAILAMYAPDATMEDPVGAAPARGRDEIAALYRAGFDMGITLALDGAIRCAGSAAVFPLCASAGEARLYIIDLFEFDARGQIAGMKAYWSRDNLVGEMDV